MAYQISINEMLVRAILILPLTVVWGSRDNTALPRAMDPQSHHIQIIILSHEEPLWLCTFLQCRGFTYSRVQDSPYANGRLFNTIACQFLFLVFGVGVVRWGGILFTLFCICYGMFYVVSFITQVIYVFMIVHIDAMFVACTKSTLQRAIFWDSPAGFLIPYQYILINRICSIFQSIIWH